MIYFKFKNKPLVFFFHCKGGTTTFKYYLYENFLKKEYEDLDYELKKINIHNLLRKYKSKVFDIGYIYNNNDIKKIINENKNFKFIYIHRNYKDRLISCFNDKFVNKECLNEILKNNYDYEEFSFEDFILLNINNKLSINLHWEPYPKLWNKIDKIIINLNNLLEINNILKKYNLPLVINNIKNKSNINLIKINDYNKKINIKNILELKKQNRYISYSLFFNNKLDNLIKDKFGHEIIL